MLSAKQGNIKYHFLSLLCDSTWDWTQVSRAIGEHSTHLANGLVLQENKMGQIFFTIFIEVFH